MDRVEKIRNYITVSDAVGEKIIPEFGGVNQEKAPVISAYLKRMSGKNPQEIVEERYRRFRKM